MKDLFIPTIVISLFLISKKLQAKSTDFISKDYCKFKYSNTCRKAVIFFRDISNLCSGFLSGQLARWMDRWADGIPSFLSYLPFLPFFPSIPPSILSFLSFFSFLPFIPSNGRKNSLWPARWMNLISLPPAGRTDRLMDGGNILKKIMS